MHHNSVVVHWNSQWNAALATPMLHVVDQDEVLVHNMLHHNLRLWYSIVAYSFFLCCITTYGCDAAKYQQVCHLLLICCFAAYCCVLLAFGQQNIMKVSFGWTT